MTWKGWMSATRLQERETQAQRSFRGRGRWPALPASRSCQTACGQANKIARWSVSSLHLPSIFADRDAFENHRLEQRRSLGRRCGAAANRGIVLISVPAVGPRSMATPTLSVARPRGFPGSSLPAKASICRSALRRAGKHFRCRKVARGQTVQGHRDSADRLDVFLRRLVQLADVMVRGSSSRRRSSSRSARSSSRASSSCFFFATLVKWRALARPRRYRNRSEGRLSCWAGSRACLGGALMTF